MWHWGTICYDPHTHLLPRSLGCDVIVRTALHRRKESSGVATVLVTGGTGMLGRAVIARLSNRRHHVQMLSRRSGLVFPGVEVIAGDLVSGSGLQGAVAGTHTLLRAAASGGSPHLIFPSIVGVDRSTYAYYRAKHVAERLIEHAPLPWTIVRITQFHDLVLGLIRSFGADTQPVLAVIQGMRFQSIDVDEVAGSITWEGFLHRLSRHEQVGDGRRATGT